MLLQELLIQTSIALFAQMACGRHMAVRGQNFHGLGLCLPICGLCSLTAYATRFHKGHADVTRKHRVVERPSVIRPE